MMLEIGPAQREWHARWCRYVGAVFTRASFERWIDWGEWGADYRALALVRDDEIVAGVGLTRMTLLLEGVALEAWQLGAVGCRPEWRSLGYARTAMRAALERIGAAPALLYANPTVMDFYPRFGFAHHEETAFWVDQTVVPRGPLAPQLDWQDVGTRALVHELSTNGVSVTERFGARGYGPVISWYAANGFARSLRQLAPRTLVVAGVEQDTLYVDDIMTDGVFDLAPVLPRLTEVPVKRICFGFSPERWWPVSLLRAPDSSGCLFTRGFAPPARGRFPELART